MDREALRGWIAKHPQVAEQLLRVQATGCAAPTTPSPTLSSPTFPAEAPNNYWSWRSASAPQRRMFDVAKGILMAVRRCTLAEAFEDLVGTAASSEIGVFALSRAVVALVEGDQADDAAAAAAYMAWGEVRRHDDLR
jgi:hypothetical protein